MMYVPSKLVFLFFGVIITHASCGTNEAIYTVPVGQLLELQPIERKAQFTHMNISYHHSRIFENHRMLQDVAASPDVTDSYGDIVRPVPPLPGHQRLNAPKPKIAKSSKSKVGRLSGKGTQPDKKETAYTISSPNKAADANRSESSSSSRTTVRWDVVFILLTMNLSFLF
uniref:Uncharacterized protein n=1 Tax=Chaetoceros debilis TaxID=122233 RepID=A0A7S3PY49_9STRA